MSNGGAQKEGKKKAGRVHIMHEVYDRGLMRELELPMVFAALGDFSGNAGRKKPSSEWTLVDISTDNLAKVMDQMGTALDIVVDDEISGTGTRRVKLRFKSMDDFDPAAIASMVPELRELLDERDRLAEVLRLSDSKPALMGVLDRYSRGDERTGGGTHG